MVDGQAITDEGVIITGKLDRDRLRTARRQNVLSSETEVYHYTSLAAFQGIVNEGGFWASDNRFLNDAEEMTHGAELASCVLRRRAQRRSTPRFTAILERVDAWVTSITSNSSLVACFSTKRDSLEQWRAYGGSLPVCIKVGGEVSGGTPVFFGPNQQLYKVVYDHRPKMILLVSAIREVEQEHLSRARTSPELWPIRHDNDHTVLLTQKIASRILAFKNSAFKEESEVRLIIPISTPEQDRTDALRFRVTSLGLVPYVCTRHQGGVSGLLPIQEIIVGPSPRQKLIGESVRSFLDHKGYKETIVTLSAIPYRAP